MRSWICLTFIGFRRCIKIHINIDSLWVHRSFRPSLYPFFSQNRLHIKQKYYETAYSRSGINQMWILKNSKELLDHLNSLNFNLITNIKPFDFLTLCTTIPHQKLKIRIATFIRISFIHKKWKSEIQISSFRSWGPYFVREHSESKSKYTEEDIIRMLVFLVDNIFVVFAGKVYQQIIGIPVGTNCAPLLAGIFLCLYEAEFIQSLLDRLETVSISVQLHM